MKSLLNAFAFVVVASFAAVANEAAPAAAVDHKAACEAHVAALKAEKKDEAVKQAEELLGKGEFEACTKVGK